MQPVDYTTTTPDEHQINCLSDIDIQAVDCLTDLHQHIPSLDFSDEKSHHQWKVTKLELSSGKKADYPHSTIDIDDESPVRETFISLPEATSGKKRLNRVASSYIQKNFAKRNPTRVSAELLAKKIDIIYMAKIAQDIADSNTVSIGEVISYIQHNDFLFSNIQRRLSLLKEVLFEFTSHQGKRTQQLSKLYDLLSSLLHQKNLIEFISEIEKISSAEDKDTKKNWKLISMAFENEKHSSESVLELLRDWATPSDKIMGDLMQGIKLHTIPGAKDFWAEPDDNNSLIYRILADDVVRSLFPTDVVLMNSITINDQDFHSPENPHAAKSQNTFFYSLLNEIYQAANLQKKEIEIRRDVSVLIKASKLNREELEELLETHPLEVFNILRLCTFNFWGVCDGLLRSRYSGLFENPFCCKMQQGTNCDFQITSLSDFSVKVTKSYTVFFRLNLDSVETFPIPDMNKKLCTIAISWTLKKEDSSWIGVLEIERLEWDPYITTTDQRALANIFIPKERTVYSGPSTSLTFSATDTASSSGVNDASLANSSDSIDKFSIPLTASSAEAAMVNIDSSLPGDINLKIHSEPDIRVHKKHTKKSQRPKLDKIFQ